LKPKLFHSLLAMASLAIPPVVYAQAGPRVAVYTNFESHPSERSMNEMKREVEALLQPAGLHVDWRSLDSASGESFSDLYVVHFRGHCLVDRFHLLFSELGPYGDTVVLGATKTVDERIQPFGSLECDPIRRSITPRILGLAHPEREAVFGRALGRVLAHELYHMMTKSAKHAHAGVFKASHKRDDLLSERFAFEQKEQSELRRIAQRLRSGSEKP